MTAWLRAMVERWRFCRRLRALEADHDLLYQRVTNVEDQVRHLSDAPAPKVHKTWVPGNREAAVIERRLLEQSARRVAGMAAKARRLGG